MSFRQRSSTDWWGQEQSFFSQHNRGNHSQLHWGADEARGQNSPAEDDRVSQRGSEHKTSLELLICLSTSLDSRRGPEYPEKLHADTGRTCKLPTKKPLTNKMLTGCPGLSSETAPHRTWRRRGASRGHPEQVLGAAQVTPFETKEQPELLPNDWACL